MQVLGNWWRKKGVKEVRNKQEQNNKTLETMFTLTYKQEQRRKMEGKKQRKKRRKLFKNSLQDVSLLSLVDRGRRQTRSMLIDPSKPSVELQQCGRLLHEACTLSSTKVWATSGFWLWGWDPSCSVCIILGASQQLKLGSFSLLPYAGLN